MRLTLRAAVSCCLLMAFTAAAFPAESHGRPRPSLAPSPELRRFSLAEPTLDKGSLAPHWRKVSRLLREGVVRAADRAGALAVNRRSKSCAAPTGSPRVWR